MAGMDLIIIILKHGHIDCTHGGCIRNVFAKLMFTTKSRLSVNAVALSTARFNDLIQLF